MAFRTILIGAAALAAASGTARAQSPFPPVGQEPQQAQACVDQFMAMRSEVDKHFTAVKAAIDKKSSAADVCKLLVRFTESEVKIIKYVEQSGAFCNFPPNVLPSMKASHEQSLGYRKQACAAAAQPRRPAEPTLSDLLSPPAVNSQNTRTGRGTLDSLTGNPIGR